MLELRLGEQVIGLYGEGETVRLPDGDAVSPAQVGPIFGKDWYFAQYVPPVPPEPTIEEIREGMTPLSARQLRLALLSVGIHEADIDARLSDDPAGMIEWQYASYYKRSHPLINQLGPLFSITPEQIDSLWLWAGDI